MSNLTNRVTKDKLRNPGHGLRVKRMDDAVYGERRRVMAWIYRARDLLRAEGIELPRIDLRVCDAHERILGCATLGRAAIWLTTHDMLLDDAHLGHTVMHEIVHAVLAFGHDDACPLMRPVHPSRVNVAVAEAAFVDYFKRHA
jgi:hypothetical protein